MLIGEARGDDEATAVRGAGGHLAAVELHALADAHEAMTGAAPFIGPWPLSRSRAGARPRDAGPPPRPGWRRMLEHVRECLLDDPVRGEVQSASQRKRLALDLQADGGPPFGPLDQWLKVVEAGLGLQLGPGVAIAHRSEEAAHLGQRRPAGRSTSSSASLSSLEDSAACAGSLRPAGP